MKFFEGDIDVIGDLALVGQPIKGHIIGARPGHKANIEFARKLKSLSSNLSDMIIFQSKSVYFSSRWLIFLNSYCFLFSFFILCFSFLFEQF